MPGATGGRAIGRRLQWAGPGCITGKKEGESTGAAKAFGKCSPRLAQKERFQSGGSIVAS